MPSVKSSDSVLHHDSRVTVRLLKHLANEAKERAQAQADWYDAGSHWKAPVSRGLRGLAILAGVVGGLCPLLPESLASTLPLIPKEWGYLLLALSGSFLLADRLFGVSSSWMRYKMAQMQIEASLRSYDLATRLMLDSQAEEAVVSLETSARFVELTKAFVEETEAVVVKETKLWVAEFQSSLLQLEQYLNQARSGGGRTAGPGSTL